MLLAALAVLGTGAALGAGAALGTGALLDVLPPLPPFLLLLLLLLPLPPLPDALERVDGFVAAAAAAAAFLLLSAAFDRGDRTGVHPSSPSMIEAGRNQSLDDDVDGGREVGVGGRERGRRGRRGGVDHDSGVGFTRWIRNPVGFGT